MYINPLEENQTLLGANPATYTPLNLPQSSAPTMPMNSLAQVKARPQQAAPQLLAHGGMASDYYSGGEDEQPSHHSDTDHLIKAHFNPEELKYLDHIQGATVKEGHPRLRSYADLDKVVVNPHVMSNVHMHTREHLAAGGPAQPMGRAEASDGINGDTELAYIGPHLHHLLDVYAGQKTRNPYDGHPQYFSLSGLLGGLGKAIGGIPLIGGALSSVAQNVLPMAGTALGTMMGGPMGGMLGSQGASMLSNSMFGGQGGAQGAQPQQAAPSYNPSMGIGSQLRSAAMSGLGNHFAQNTSALGQGASAGFNALANGQGFRGAANSAFQGAGGMQGLQRAGMDAFNAYRNGGQSPGAALRYGASSYTAPQYGPQPMPQGYQQQMPQMQPQMPQAYPQPYQQQPMGQRMPQMYDDLD